MFILSADFSTLAIAKSCVKVLFIRIDLGIHFTCWQLSLGSLEVSAEVYYASKQDRSLIESARGLTAKKCT